MCLAVNFRQKVIPVFEKYTYFYDNIFIVPPNDLRLPRSVQAVFLRTFPAVYGELLKIFTVREVAGFVRETLGSLPTAVHADCLEAVKLQCIAKTVESQLYINPGKDLFTQTDAPFDTHT